MLEMFEKEKTVCPECNGTGWVVVNTTDNVVRPCSCLLKTIKDNKLRFANIPPKYADKRVTDITTEMYSKLESVDRIKTAIAALKEYIERIDEMQGAGQGLYLYSNANIKTDSKITDIVTIKGKKYFFTVFCSLGETSLIFESYSFNPS